MDNLEQQINEQLDIPVETNESVEPQVQEAEEATPEQEAQEALWKQDKRFEKGLWKTEDDVFETVRHYETKFHPIQNVLSKEGIKDADGLKEILTKHSDYANPESDINQTYEYMNNLFKHPEYGDRAQKFFNDIAQDIEKAKYGGVELPEEIKERLDKVDSYERKLQEQELREKSESFEKIMQSDIKEISSLCEQKGLEFDAKLFLEECQQKNIPLSEKALFNHFLSENYSELEKASNELAISKALEQSSKNSNANINSSGRLMEKIDSAPKDHRELESIILSKLGE